MIAVIIQARMGSTRLPGKTLKNLAGQPMLWHVVERCRRIRNVNELIIVTTVNHEDDAIETFCKKQNILCMRGSSENVLDRYYHAARAAHSDIVIRIPADKPLVDPETAEKCLAALHDGYDYVSNVFPPGINSEYPGGLAVEVFSFRALEKAYHSAADEYEKEHVTPYIWQNKSGEFKTKKVAAPPEYARRYRLTVDYPEDFELMAEIYKQLYRTGEIIDAKEAIRFLDEHPEIAAIELRKKQYE